MCPAGYMQVKALRRAMHLHKGHTLHVLILITLVGGAQLTAARYVIAPAHRFVSDWSDNRLQPFMAGSERLFFISVAGLQDYQSVARLPLLA